MDGTHGPLFLHHLDGLGGVRSRLISDVKVFRT